MRYVAIWLRKSICLSTTGVGVTPAFHNGVVPPSYPIGTSHDTITGTTAEYRTAPLPSALPYIDRRLAHRC
jgi:hypothetical protein